MKYDIAQIADEFQNELNIDNWLTMIGDYSANTISLFTPFKVQIVEVSKVAKLIKSDEWSDIDLEIFAQITNFTDNVLRDYELTDVLAKFGREILTPHKKNLENKIAICGLPKDIYEYSLFAITMRAFQEFGVRKVDKRFSVDFNSNLLKILNLGYLPCGWSLNRHTKNQAYNPLTFITDTIKKQDKMAKFSYNSGVLYVC